MWKVLSVMLICDNYVLHSFYVAKVKKVENEILRCQMKNSKEKQNFQFGKTCLKQMNC